MLQPKDTGLLNGYKNKTHIYAVYKRPTSDLGTHTDLESVIQSEVSQKEKNKYRMLTHIYGI